MSDLRLDGLIKRYGSIAAVDGISLSVAEGSFLSLVGPSGCGKTTVLRMVAGLIEPDGGRIFVGGDDITDVAVHKRNLGLVFQSYALFPHMTVAQNVAFGLQRRGVARSEIDARVRKALQMVRLDGLAERAPRQLSGGQQQRTALARALVVEPRLLLLDEPFSNLDALLRDEMRIEIKRLQQEVGITTLFVTHDQGEALGMADQVAVMNRGRLEQVASPRALYSAPTSAFVAHFIGRANLLPGTVQGRDGEDLIIALASGTKARARGELGSGACRVVVRQESVRLVRTPTTAANSFAAIVVVASFAGAIAQYLVRLDDGIELHVQAPGARAGLGPGTAIIAEWDATDTTVVPDVA
ncbi:ABC transporter ATP-binding protein [Reyranella sp. CPCC 100927]|uniref:ABC transporter ATP-binding protein n=1 Tax=Reyranella sp. CPCC 100927 TaxID=2599616 RepID=UPI0011B788A1|nr:ABC transporter ATP-binding protein [Reyranella sp. CPCC 100927]TWT09432.1 ABC transporter ATP-binding protein [Reyranella sp. CPCC 100927]